MRKFSCLTCNNEFESKKACKSREPKYCSKECYSVSLRKYKVCANCKTEFYNFKNNKYCSKDCSKVNLKGTKLTNEHKNKISRARKKSEKCKGENLYNWKGGKETEAFRLKQSFYKRKNSLKLKMPILFLNRILKAQKNACFFCEADLTNYKAIEHLTPVSKGGDNEKCNLVYSCKSCNSKKRQNTLEEYAIKQNRIDWLNKWELTFIEAL
jgi:hypothetical protein